MNLQDLINNCEDLIKERIDYIFNSFKKYFPDVRYDERSSILGIGERGKHLLCYFKKLENNVLVKFKSNKDAVSITVSISEIDLYVKETTELFQTNSFSKRKKSIEGEDLSFRKIDDAIIEKEDFVDLLNAVIPDKGDLLIENFASHRLNNALKAVGVNKISDLAGWSSLKILNIQNFGKVCYNELCIILYTLKNGKVPEKIENDFSFLYDKAYKAKVRKFSTSSEVNSYLMAINFDENHFLEGTVGRALCLRKKVQEITNFVFCKESEELKDAYLSYKEEFDNLLEKTIILLADFVNQVIQDERNRNIVLSLLSIDGKRYSLKALGETYDITREAVRQIFKREIKKLTFSFNLYCEEGILRYLQRAEYLSFFETCPVDAFMLYLQIEKLDYVQKAFQRVMLYNCTIPENVLGRIDEARNLLKEKSIKSSSQSGNLTKRKGFELMINDDGEILTDLELLEKLKQARFEIAIELNCPAFMVYHNKHLVRLATFKPVSREMYSLLSGFTDKTWDKYGHIMVDIIKKHVQSIK